jgi:hypothetical protein
MFVTKMCKLFIESSKHDVHEVHPLLQLPNPLFPILLQRIQKDVVVPCFVPNVIGGVVFPKELLSHLVVLSNGGRGVVQVLFDVVGGSGLIRRDGNKGGSSGVERHSGISGL